MTGKALDLLDQLPRISVQSSQALSEGDLIHVASLDKKWAKLIRQLEQRALPLPYHLQVLLSGSKRFSQLGEYAQLSRRFEEAASHYQQALAYLDAIRQQPGYEALFPDHHLRLLYVQTYGLLANLHRLLSQWPKARAASRAAIEALPANYPTDDENYTTYLKEYQEAHSMQAMLHSDEKQFDKAAAIYEDLLRFSEENKYLPGQIQTYNNWGAMSYRRTFGQDEAKKQTHYQHAEWCFEQVELLKRQSNQSRFFNSITDDVNAGTVYCGMKKYDKALFHLKRALDQSDAYIAKAAAPDQHRFRENHVFCEQMIVLALVNLGLCRDAFVFLEKRRSEVSPPLPSGSLPFTHQHQGNKVRQVLRPQEAFLTFSNTDQDRFVVLLVRADRTIGLEINYADFAEELHATHQVSIEQLLGTKPRFTQQVPYGNHVPDGLLKRYKNYNLLRLLHWFRILLARQDMFDMPLIRSVAQRLYALFIQPIANYLDGIDHLYLSTDASLALLPFEVLCDEHNKYLIERYTISYTRTLHELSYLKHRRSQQQPKASAPLLIVKNSLYVQEQAEQEAVLTADERNEILIRYHRGTMTNRDFKRLYGRINFSPLGAVEEEVTRLKAVIPQAVVLSGQPLKKSVFLARAREGKLHPYRHVHFALHGIAYPDLPQLSALLFYHPQPTFRNTFLTIGELAQLTAAFEADLISLGACETAIGGIYQAAGGNGIANSLLKAGANAVIASLWEINSERTVQFMEAFYSQLQEPYQYAETLRSVKLPYINRSDYLRHPAYWAAFILNGLP